MIESAEKKLYVAASKGDVIALKEVVEKDAYLLDEAAFAFSRNLLHIATMRGQAGIVEEVLKMNPRLARSLDSEKASPLHIAAAEGNIEIAKKLLSVAPEMCWSRDCQNMNPIHVAAMNGHVEMLEELLQIDYLPAMERVYRGQTVLHLCVKYHQLRALELLVEKLSDLVDATDEDGKTILDWAVRSRQHEMIRYLVEINKREKEAESVLLEGNPRGATNHNSIIQRVLPAKLQTVSLPKMTDTTMVVVVLIATMAFQAAVCPPGGVWQDDSSTHKAGEAVMAYTHPRIYKHFVRANTTAFISSLITIFLITTGETSKSLPILSIGIYTMWVALTSIAVSYGASVMVITPNTETQSLHHVIGIAVAMPFTILGVIYVGKVIYWLCCLVFNCRLQYLSLV